MIVIFGSSSDIGQRLIAKLAGLPCRAVSRRMADLETGEGVEAAMKGATIVVSCAHARFTEVLLAAAPTSAKLVLTGSAWRYSGVPNERADQVRCAEALFLASGFRGVMLHPTMIYGGHQENNIQRLLSVIRRCPVIPAPGGGHQIVRPIYIDDVVDCLHAAVVREWSGVSAFGIAGPPLTWRRMVEISAEAIGLRRKLISVPASPFVVLFKMIGIDPNVIRRFSEDVTVSMDGMTELLAVTPRAFASGIAASVNNQFEISPLGSS